MKNLSHGLALVTAIGVSTASLAQSADKPVAELGGYGVLTMPKGKPRGSIILMAALASRPTARSHGFRATSLCAHAEVMPLPVLPR
jgi:hypothetical protein